MILFNYFSMLARLSLILAVLMALPSASRANEIELSAAQVASAWNNINGALIVIGASTAIDDDWTESFKAMAAAPVQGKTLGDVVSQAELFRKKLNVLLAENEFEPMTFGVNPILASDSPPMVYLNSGRVMDALILLLNQIDPLAFIAQYYALDNDKEKTANDAYASVALANQRMDAYMEENGIEMPESDASESGGS